MPCSFHAAAVFSSIVILQTIWAVVWMSYLRYEEMMRSKQQIKHKYRCCWCECCKVPAFFNAPLRALEETVEVPLIALSQEQEKMREHALEWRRSQPTPPICCAGEDPEDEVTPRSRRAAPGWWCCPLTNSLVEDSTYARVARQSLDDCEMCCAAYPAIASAGSACWKLISSCWSWLCYTSRDCMGTAGCASCAECV